MLGLRLLLLMWLLGCLEPANELKRVSRSRSTRVSMDYAICENFLGITKRNL
jgi:hypothetical protein